MKRLFLIVLAVALCMSLGLAGILFISLLPYAGLIGGAATGLLLVAMLCALYWLLVFTYTHTSILLSRRKKEALHASIIVAGEVVAVPEENGTYTHLSAQHMAASIPPPPVTVQQIDAPQAPAPIADNDTVLDLYNRGINLRDIALATGRTYYQVQKITSAAKQ